MIGHLVLEVRMLLFYFDQVSGVHEMWKGNVSAHLLSLSALSLVHRAVWWDCFPSDAISAAVADVH